MREQADATSRGGGTLAVEVSITAAVWAVSLPRAIPVCDGAHLLTHEDGTVASRPESASATR